MERFYFVNLVEKLLEHITQFRPEKALIMSGDYLNMKMLEGGKIDPMDDNFRMFTDAVKNDVEDLLEGAEVKETGLALTTYQAVLPAKHYNSNTLMTVEQHEKHIRWNIMNERRVELQEKLDKLGANPKEDLIAFHKLLWEKREDVLAAAFSADNVYLIMESPVSGFNAAKTEISRDRFAAKYKNTNSVFDFRTHWDYVSYLGISRGYSHSKELCPFCNNNYTRKQKEVYIRHYKHLMFMLKIEERNELPPYLRNYRAHEKIQYRGNNILDHIHPYASLRDPASERYPNGLRVGIYCCNKCAKKFSEEYFIEDNVEFEIL